ncbi:MAG: glutathione S-transferase [Pseudomonadota bacterium]
MRLIGSAKSHFTRKVRLLFDHLEHPYELVDVGNVAEQNPDIFAGNPLMSVPVLVDNQSKIFGSDHIAAFIVRQLYPIDVYAVNSTDPNVLNARALLNGAMQAEVKLVLSERTGLDTTGRAYFEKARAILRNVLDWCEANVRLFDTDQISYLQFHLISFWDHAHHYRLVAGNWPRLNTLIAEMSLSQLVAKSSPTEG